MPDLWLFLLVFMLATWIVLDGFDLGAGILHLPVARGDADTAIQALEALLELGSDNPMAYLTDPTLQPLRGNPRYEALLRQIARNWLAHYEELENKAPGFGVVDAVLYYILLGELDKAERLLDEAQRDPGAVSPQTLDQLRESVRRERAALEIPG